MTAQTSANEFDVIIIGSGISGMASGAALSRMDHKVLLLEQAPNLGGLTHSFSRNGFTWDVGLHYCGLFSDEQFAGRSLNWLSDGAVKFESVGTVYDTLHFPDGFDLSVGRPAEAFKMELKEHFPDNRSEIDNFFEALKSGEEAGHLATFEHVIPESLRAAHRWWNKKKLDRWCQRTTGEVISDIISNPKLAAVLSAQWGTYGGHPSEASFAIHSIIISHYLDGARYPVGGAASIAEGLIPVIEAAGGSAFADTPVTDIVLKDDKAIGVRTQSGEEYFAPQIVSTIGARETLKYLLPEKIRNQPWAKEVMTFKPSICHFDLFLGFEGDITQHGATRSNHWFYESWNTRDAVWSAKPDEPINSIFVSFGSLKDTAHDPGPDKKYSADVLVWTDWSAVEEFADGGAKEKPEAWKAFKERIESQILAQFKKKFPDLAPLIAYHELGTPLATAAFTGHEKGGFYGIETTPRRLMSEALSIRTPVPGLLLSGQDVITPGIAGAFSAGMLTAAVIDPRVFQKFK